MIDANILGNIQIAQKKYKNAVRANIGIAAAKQAYTNYLLSYGDDLIESALDSNDLMRQLMEAKKKIRELESGNTGVVASETGA